MMMNIYDVVFTELVFLGEGLYVISRVGAHGEKADHGRPRNTLLPHLLEVQDDALRVLLAQRIRDVFPGLRERAIGAPRADEQQAAEYVKRVIVAVRDDFLFRSLFIKPLFPLLLIARHLVDEKRITLRDELLAVI